MLTKIDNSLKFGKKHGGFGIEILYPGTIVPDSDDTGIATIGRIDQAIVTPGTLIPMHPHRDDEILTYLRKGKVKHLDSEGTTAHISNTKLMMMNAGARFYHEELVLEEGGILKGLQIFIRPETGGLKAQVQFHDLPEAFSVNQWRKLAGKGDEYPLEIRSSTWIEDIQMTKDNEQSLPQLPIQNPTILFYVFEGEVKVNDDLVLKTGESILIEKESPTFYALQTSDVVLFITNKNAPYFEGGMYSGNQQKVR
jgi:redox-sensitive bicupin YhaK (pirin superfamily)